MDNLSGGSSRRRVVIALVLVAGLLFAASACRPTRHPISATSRCVVGVVGDSLTVGSWPWWERAFGDRGCGVSFVDARGGRPTIEGVRVIEELARTGRLPDILVVALGTNDSMDPRLFGPLVDRVMALSGGRPVMWVNIDKPWVEATLNLTLAVAEIKYRNLWIYNWNAFVDAHPQIRLPDQVHLTDGGYALRAALIAREVTGR